MSIKTKYSCGHCGRTISGYSKKGFQSLHTSIGIPKLKCVRCGNQIETGHKPFQDMSSAEKSWEIIKISFNILIYSVIYGGIIGMLLCAAIDEYILGVEKGASSIHYDVMSFAILGIFALHVPTYIKWAKRVSLRVELDGDSCESSSYNHPDW
tara:strand:+ start:1104 stop:1562 length:459 start_codon:yes stop_codon:yes gene_type:complete